MTIAGGTLGRSLLAACTALALAACAPRGGGGTALLAGSSWLAHSIDGQAAPSYPASTLDFVTATEISGRAGCVTYSGTIGVAGDQLAVGPLTTRQIACEQDPLGLTSRFLQALQAARSFQVSEWNLGLADASGRERLTFTRLTGPL